MNRVADRHKEQKMTLFTSGFLPFSGVVADRRLTFTIFLDFYEIS